MARESLGFHESALHYLALLSTALTTSGLALHYLSTDSAALDSGLVLH
jgi:hypothetical protein